MKRIWVSRCVCVAGLFSTVCFLAFFCASLLQTAELPTRLLGLSAVCVCALPLLLSGFAKKRLPRRLFAVLRCLYGCGVVFFTVTFAALCIGILRFQTPLPENTPVSAVLVYGCRTNGDEPGTMLRERLDCAYTVLCDAPDAVCIVSGGVDYLQEKSEGYVMAQYLIGRGISPDRIRIDETAEDTKGNLRAFRALLAAEDTDGGAIVHISSAFHMPRIAFLSGKYGFSENYTCYYLGAHSENFALLVSSVVREYMAYVKMLVLNSYQ